MRGYFGVTRTIWLKRCRLCHFTVPMAGPDTIGLTQSRLPGKHRFAKLDADCLAKKAQHPFRIFKYIFCIHDRRNRIRASAHEIKDLCLLYKAQVRQRWVLSLFDVRSDYLARVANKKAICNCAEPFAIHFWREMMRHLFLEKNPFAVRDWTDQLRDNFSPIGLARSNHFIRARMLFGGCA